MNRRVFRTFAFFALGFALTACGSTDKTSPSEGGGAGQGGTAAGAQDAPGSFSVQVDVETMDHVTASWTLQVSYHATNADGTPSSGALSASALDDLKTGVSGYAKAYAALHNNADVQDLSTVADNIKAAINGALQSGHHAVVDSIVIVKA